MQALKQYFQISQYKAFNIPLNLIKTYFYQNLLKHFFLKIHDLNIFFSLSNGETDSI